MAKDPLEKHEACTSRDAGGAAGGQWHGAPEAWASRHARVPSGNW